MRIVLNERDQQQLLLSAKARLGSERALARFLDTSKYSVYAYTRGIHTLPKIFFEKMMSLTGFSPAFTELPDNWGQTRGGKVCVQSKSSKELAKHLASVRKKALKGTIRWHKDMREKQPQKYYEKQFEKFKITGLYKVMTKRGHKVRNWLEGEVADYLYSLGLEYEYEPYVKCGDTVFFPDFKIGELVIECTAWKGEQKVEKLKTKIRVLTSHGYRIIVFVPEELRHFYKAIDAYLVSDLNQIASFLPW